MTTVVTAETPPPPPAPRRPHGDLRECIKQENSPSVTENSVTESSSVSASPSPDHPPSWVQGNEDALDVWGMITPKKEEPPPVSVPQPGGSDDVPLGPAGSTP